MKKNRLNYVPSEAQMKVPRIEAIDAMPFNLDAEVEMMAFLCHHRDHLYTPGVNLLKEDFMPLEAMFYALRVLVMDMNQQPSVTAVLNLMASEGITTPDDALVERIRAIAPGQPYDALQGARILRDFAEARRLKRVMLEALISTNNFKPNPLEAARVLSNGLEFSLEQRQEPFATAEEVMNGSLEFILRDHDSQFVPTFVPQLNGLLGGGLGRSLVATLFAKSSMGKTRFLTKQALMTATYLRDFGMPGCVVFLSQDGDPKQVLAHYVAAMYGVKVTQLREPRYASVLPMVRETLLSMRDLPLVYNDEPGISDREVKRVMQRAQRQYGGVELLIGDYLQCYDSEARYNGETERVQEFMRSWYEIVRHSGAASLLACQLGRKVDERGDKRPQLSDAKQTSEIENKSETVIGLYRDHYYDKSADPDEGEISVLKSKANGIPDLPVYMKFLHGMWVSPGGDYQPGVSPVTPVREPIPNREDDEPFDGEDDSGQLGYYD